VEAVSRLLDWLRASLRWIGPICYMVVLVLALFLLVGFLRGCGPAPVVDDRKSVALAESLATARTEARHNLQEWKKALEDRDTVIRRVVKYIARHDTAWRTGKDSLQVDTVEVVRWLAVSDSTLRVVRDSLTGEVVQARFDADQCNEALAAKPSGYWRGFGQGFTVGAASGLALCAGVR
jgi:hypothetical protein